MGFDWGLVWTGLTGIKSALDGVKALKDLVPKSDEREELSQQIELAEANLQVSEAQLAQGLGYDICRCTWPPQICLSIGRPRGYSQSQCPNCKITYPPNSEDLQQRAQVEYD